MSGQFSLTRASVRAGSIRSVVRLRLAITRQTPHHPSTFTGATNRAALSWSQVQCDRLHAESWPRAEVVGQKIHDDRILPVHHGEVVLARSLQDGVRACQ